MIRGVPDVQAPVSSVHRRRILKVLRFTRLLCLVAGLATLLPAAILTSPPVGGTTTTFPGGSGVFDGPGSATVAGFPITYTNGVVYNYNGGFGMAANGSWSWGMIGINDEVGSMTIDLGGLYDSVGGFMNYAPGYGDPTISAIAADGTTILESYVLSSVAAISTPSAVNGGEFRGIMRGTADIRYLQISNSYLSMRDITLGAGSAVPEPSAAVLVLSALGALWLRRRAA
jgi:hypothetical protein